MKKKHVRSRVLALGVAGVLVAGGALPLIPMAVAQSQGKASVGQMLARGQTLLNQGQYETAKKILLSINPSQLTPVERTTLESLLEKADVGLVASAKAADIFRNAQTSFQDGHLAHAASLYEYLMKDTSATAEIRREARDNLALTQAKQQSLVPAMNALLQKAEAAYNVKHYDQAESDLYTIRKSGVDLGSNNNGLPAKYENLIAQQRVAAVNAIVEAEKAKAAAAAEARLKAQQQAAMATQAANEAKIAMAKKQAEAAAAKLVAQRKAAEAKVAAAAHELAIQKAVAAAALAAHEKQVQQQLAAQQNKEEAQRAAQRAAVALAAQKKAAQEAAAAKLAAQQKASEAAAAKLAADQKARQAAAAAAALATRQVAQQKAAQEAAREKAALALAEKQKLAEQQKSEQLNQAHQPVVSPTAPSAVVPVSGKSVVAPKPVPVVAIPLESPAQVNAQRSSLLVVEADDAIKAGKYQNAITLYTAALALNPKNIAARLGRRNAQKLSSGQSVSLLSQTIYNNAILAQRAEVMFNTALTQSNAELQTGHYNRALNSANNAEAAATSSRHLLSPRVYDLMIARARQQIALVQQQQATASVELGKIRAEKIQQSQMQIEAKVAAERRVRINELMRTANDYYKQQQYQHALDTLDQIMAIDPHDYTARFMRRMVQDQIQYSKYNHYVNHRSHSTQESDVANEEEVIPYQRLLIYPRDWPELSRMREAEMTSSESPMDRKVTKRLEANDPKITAQQVPFETVIDLLRNQTGLNIVVNWTALAGAGVEKVAPVSLTLRDVPFKKVLEIVLQQVQGGSSTKLGYSVDQGVITISTNDQLAQQKVVRVYDIQDLLVKAPNFTDYPKFNLQSATQNTSTSVSSSGGGAAAAGGNIFGGGGGGSSKSTTTSRKAMVREITKLIENTVDRNSWVANSGTVGSIREISGQLVISQTPEAQQKIAGLLQQLRESKAIQISIEARFLLVSTNFLNDFAFGWNLTFPSSFFGGPVGGPPLTINNNTAALATPQSTGIVGSLGGAGQGTGATSSANSLDVSGGILSSYQLNLFMQATQEDVHTTTLTAPRITLFNGQSAYITVAQQQNFVASETQTASTGGGLGGGSVPATTLNVATLTTGVVLAVQATVSADHRYVVMTLQPSLSTLDGLTTFNINGQSPSTTQTGGFAPSSGGFVQLPKISLTELATTVSVPDGGTLLIGGQRLVGEVEVESGVPILSKIPIINRLFTNRSYVRDTKVLLILVRPHIIIQKEAEKAQFGQNY